MESRAAHQTPHVVDVRFRIHGDTLPVDHGFALYSALSRIVPAIHTGKSYGIHPIRGQVIGNRSLAVTPRSRLAIRTGVERIPDLIPLAGKRIEVSGNAISIGTPSVFALRPNATLVSRLVTIKGFTDPESFIEAIARQLSELAISGTPRLVQRQMPRSLEGRTGGIGGFVRRTVRIRDREIIGFAVIVESLGAEDSLRLQALGLGGRRSFGCGIFEPGPRR